MAFWNLPEHALEASFIFSTNNDFEGWLDLDTFSTHSNTSAPNTPMTSHSSVPSTPSVMHMSAPGTPLPLAPTFGTVNLLDVHLPDTSSTSPPVGLLLADYDLDLCQSIAPLTPKEAAAQLVKERWGEETIRKLTKQEYMDLKANNMHLALGFETVRRRSNNNKALTKYRTKKRVQKEQEARQVESLTKYIAALQAQVKSLGGKPVLTPAM